MTLLSPLTVSSAQQILTNLGRVNAFVERGPEGPTQSQVDLFIRGYDAVRNDAERLGLTAEQIQIDPSAIYRTVTASDFDGTAINSTWATAQVAAKGLSFYLNRDVLGPVRKVIPQIPTFDTEVTICTAWRAGLVEYLLGATYALGGGYPFITYGWSRRIARMSYEDAASRAIFLGHGYELSNAIERAQKPFSGSPEEWEGLDETKKKELVIDVIESDLRQSPSFMTTEDLGLVARGVLEKLERGSQAWKADEWTPEEVEQLGFLFKRRFIKDHVQPAGGYSIHVGGKMPMWAKAADKPHLAAALKHKGLADDASKHLDPLIANGGRGIHVEGGQEFLPVRGGAHAHELMATHFRDAAETTRIISAMEEPYDPSSGGKEIRIPHSPANPATHNGLGDKLSPFQREVASIVLRNPSADLPVELDFFWHEYPLEVPYGQHNGVRWDAEDRIANLVRHGVANPEPSLSRRAWIGLWSGAEIGLARVATRLMQGEWNMGVALEFGVFAVSGAVSETIFGRTISGKAIPSFAGGALSMAAAAAVYQAAEHQEVQIMQDLAYGATFAALQIPIQRSLIPATLTAYARRIAKALATKQTTRAERTMSRTRWLGRFLSAGMTTVSQFLARLVAG